MLVHCPICPSIFAEQVLKRYKVIAKKEGESEVGALATYRCPAGHIFFVRLADLLSPSAFVEESAEHQFPNN